MKNFNKNILIWIAIILGTLIIYNIFQASSQTTASSIPFSDFLHEAERGQISDVFIRGNVLTGHLSTGQLFTTYMPNQTNIMAFLADRDIRISAGPLEEFSFFQMILSWLPMIILAGIWIFALRQMQGGGGKIMGFGKSRARLLNEKQGRVTFEDVAGIEEAKQELEEIVEFLKYPKKFQRLGGEIPKGVLLIGPPGTGKTLLARAIAGEANVPFFTISGSDFVEMFVGVGASRVRDMFEQAKKSAPCIVFIDEIDAVGRHRGAGMGGGNDEREQTLNQLLVEMDGFESNEGVILIAATNRPDVLDPALLRPGRFDRRVVVPDPDLTGREKILLVHMRKIPLSKDVDATVIARGTPGFSGADLKNLVNEAALLAARRNKRSVTMGEFEEAKDKVMMGTERRSMLMTEEERKLTAYHESGHALVAVRMEDSDPIHKATIIPRGRALGMVVRLPENDQRSVTKAKLEADLAVAMGGRIAEEIIFGPEKITTGASSDIKMATDMARRMVTEWGMSPELGPLSYGERNPEFSPYGSGQQFSDTTTLSIDKEIRKIVDAAYKKAFTIINESIEDLHRLAKALLEHETLTGEEIHLTLNGRPLDRPTQKPPIKKGASVPTSRPARSSHSKNPTPSPQT